MDSQLSSHHVKEAYSLCGDLIIAMKPQTRKGRRSSKSSRAIGEQPRNLVPSMQSMKAFSRTFLMKIGLVAKWYGKVS